MNLRVLILALLLVPAVYGQQPAKGGSMSHHATGTFDPIIKPVPPDFPAAPLLGRMTIDKTFHGGIEATSVGQMLTAMTDVKGSAGYVAVEFVTGKVEGRSGSFSLVHRGIMDHGKPELSVTVVPDSGTGELSGLTGSLTIDIAADGKHSYTFDYSLPAKP